MDCEAESYSVLHVDDDSGITDLTEGISENEGYPDIEFDVVNDPEKVFNILEGEEDSYDAVVSDLEMGSMFGLDLADKVEDDYGLPVVIYSNRDDVAEEVYAEAKDEAMRDFVAKNNVFDDFPELRHSVVQTVEYSRKSDEAEQLREMAYDLVANLKHDMMNPLGVAKGYVEVLQEQTEDFQRNCGLDMNIISQLERVEEIVDDTLEYAEGVNITEDDMEKIDLEDVAEKAFEHLNTEELDEEYEIEFNTRKMGEVKADKSRVKNMLTNLYCNSIDHSGTKELEIETGELKSFATSTRAPTQPKGIYIEDNGVGIPEDKQSEILNQGETTKEGHTGFGLATVKEIAERHGWDTKVTESQSGGARFEFRFR